MRRKSLISASILAAMSLWFITCGGGSPDGIPKAFVEALAKGNSSGVKRLTTEGFAPEALRGLEQFKNVKISISKFRVIDKRDSGENKKNIRVEYISEVRLKKEKGRAIKLKNDMMFHLVKTKKNWRIERISEASPAQLLK
jgi:hypothetical protein